ncbi:E3 ubiquitin-protein ligase HEL2 [Spathaspora sp. JA1]|nr:E3 ubiquitin-protein ligase HEL2 [Spathaspora sp. JA1]
MSEKTNTPTDKKPRVSRGGHHQKSSKGYKKRPNDATSPSSTQAEADIPPEEQCIICAERIQYAALTPCSHTTCHKCTFRQRALYSRTICLICRTENPHVIFTEQIDKEYNDFSDRDVVVKNEKYGIWFTQSYVETDTLNLLAYTCSICNEPCDSFKALSNHAKEIHSKYYCHLCEKFKHAFISELPLYTARQLQRHQSEGDGEDSGFKGHPECKHCHHKNNRYYSEDELNVHIRDKHERCHICDQFNRKSADYYRNYDALYHHFKKDHYVCLVPSCIEKKFVVFRDDLDLTAHMLKEHGGVVGGGSNRIVIGSNSHFSQLSTFSDSSRRAGVAPVNWNDDEQQTPEIKLKRFEERAKHYLNYDQSKYEEFLSLNASFKSKKITASELVALYKQDLFIDQSSDELNLLVREFAEFFPASSDLRRDLDSVSRDTAITETESENFPVLGGRPIGSMGLWVGSRRTPSPKPDKFPTLSKPVKKPLVTPQPIKYTNVIKSTKKPVTTPVTNRAPVASNYRPTYLDNNSSPSLPVSGQSSRSSTPVQASSSLSSEPTKFPTLEKKQRKVIPTVKQYNIADPNSWSKNAVQPPVVRRSTTPTDEWGGIPIIDKRKGKLKKKGGVVSDLV